MNTESLVRNAKVLIRAERILADIRFKQAGARIALTVTAGLFALFGFGMLALAAYLALETVIGPIWASTVIGAAALLVAAVLLAVAGGNGHGRELEVAQSLEAAALEALAADLKGVETDVRAATGFLRNPFDSALPGLVVPLATIVLKALRKRTDPPKS